MLQKLSPQQIQLMKLLQVPTVELEQRVKEELESNPALEEGAEDRADNNSEEYEAEGESREDFDIDSYISDDEVPSYKTYTSNASKDDEEKGIPISMGKTFHESLIRQLRLRRLSEEDFAIAEHLVGNLDEAGYLRREIPAITDDLAFSQGIMTTDEKLSDLLEVVQDLEPAGVGARDLQECLILQINRRPKFDPVVKLAKVILNEMFDAFTKKHYDKILKKLEIEEGDLKEALDEILRLNPKPGGSANESQRIAQTIIPDFILHNDEGELVLTLNQRNAPELKVSRSYSEMLKTMAESNAESISKSQKEAAMFVKQKLDSAKWFIDAIKQRQLTLSSTMNAILDYQKEYFLEGDETKLRPMILKDIADKVKLDISTISRVANSKYIQTDFGTYPLKHFFSESMETESGEEVSTREIKKILQDVIEVENKRKPLTDEKLAGHLKEKGYLIARRTVAKYREQLGIPVARLRKAL
jgi:RNA polymerase sigma-54 factor